MPAKMKLDALRLAKVILDMVVQHYGLLEFVALDRGLFCNSKIEFLLYFF